ncbi:putative prefoldin subunit 1 [Gracilariopsis chorda]|uniref:Putative prefoldin subunit 1 n=1 Tax=Gracilariopsis chorda TaxID=448386 RepID=A0A2V3J6E9_9FLOR|nr:putative prefoldin subunit 1 [Gracilariopsis chorda]|eukprot:PXF50001.1 putative prefoldin subunit 1 [Gracilariopsis chorda]
MSKQDLDQLWELQERQAELRRHVLQLTSQINSAEKERTILDVTVQEIDNMPPDVKTYVGLGKMFVLQPKSDLRSDFVHEKNESVKKDEDRKRLRKQFLSKLSENENRIDELADQIEATRAKAANTRKSAAS